MTDKVIQAGYMITVSSWENDGDFSRTESRDGLSRIQVEYYRDLLFLLTKCYHDEDSKGTIFYGNLTYGDDSTGKELEDDDPEPLSRFGRIEGTARGFQRAVRKVNDRYRDRIKEIPEESDRSFNYGFDIINDLTGYGGEWFYTRVVESIEIHYNPEPVTFVDVTNSF